MWFSLAVRSQNNFSYMVIQLAGFTKQVKDDLLNHNGILKKKGSDRSDPLKVL